MATPSADAMNSSLHYHFTLHSVTQLRPFMISTKSFGFGSGMALIVRSKVLQVWVVPRGNKRWPLSLSFSSFSSLLIRSGPFESTRNLWPSIHPFIRSFRATTAAMICQSVTTNSGKYSEARLGFGLGHNLLLFLETYVLNAALQTTNESLRHRLTGNGTWD